MESVILANSPPYRTSDQRLILRNQTKGLVLRGVLHAVSQTDTTCSLRLQCMGSTFLAASGPLVALIPSTSLLPLLRGKMVLCLRRYELPGVDRYTDVAFGMWFLPFLCRLSVACAVPFVRCGCLVSCSQGTTTVRPSCKNALSWRTMAPEIVSQISIKPRSCYLRNHKLVAISYQ